MDATCYKHNDMSSLEREKRGYDMAGIWQWINISLHTCEKASIKQDGSSSTT